MANCRAIRQIVQEGDPRRVAWDKTEHDFPVLGEQGRARRPLGRILVAQGVISEEQLATALVHRTRGLKLGSWLVHEGMITAEQLATAVAEQSGVKWERVDTLSLDPSLIQQLPSERDAFDRFRELACANHARLTGPHLQPFLPPFAGQDIGYVHP